jgi:hypothetical protein
MAGHLDPIRSGESDFLNKPVQRARIEQKLTLVRPSIAYQAMPIASGVDG